MAAGQTPSVVLVAVDDTVLAQLVRAATTDAEADEAEEEAMKPLQRPCSRLHVLKAHCWSFVHEAWKLPQTGWSMELTA